MTSEDRKDATRYLPNLWHSLVQVIIQSRLGEKSCAASKSPVKGSSMVCIIICFIHIHIFAYKILKKFLKFNLFTLFLQYMSFKSTAVYDGI